MKTELHLIVLWANARHKEKEILADIVQHLDIVDMYDIAWTPNRVAENFSRFYGTKLPNNSFKEIECGKGAFLCVVVRDGNPQYEYTKTSRGHEKVNINIFTLKEKYRLWTGGGHKIHTTNNIKETEHDTALLLGLNYEDLQKSLPKTPIVAEKINRDLSGAKGWEKLQELFYIMNATMNYVVLRNFEILPDKFASEEHGDIDLLVEDFNNAKYILNAEKVFEEEFRIHCKNMINGQLVFWDLRFVGDTYYPTVWEENILERKVLTDKNIYVPDDENLFYSMIYHALIHKQRIVTDYFDKIYVLFCKLEFNKKYDIDKYSSPFDLYLELLEEFMYLKHYTYIKPYDGSVFYSLNFVNMAEAKKRLLNTFEIDVLQVCQAHIIASHRHSFFFGILSGQSVFIKYSDNHQGMLKHEYEMTRIAYEENPKYFIKPIFFKDVDAWGCLIFEAQKGISLDKAISQNLLAVKEKEQIIDGLYQIFKILQRVDIIHRDIKPDNFIVKDGAIKLIDFQAAVQYSKKIEAPEFERNSGGLAGLGEEYRFADYIWDDAHSLLKVLEFIGTGDVYSDKYDEVYHEIKCAIGNKQFISKRKKTMVIILFMNLVKYKFKSVLHFSKSRRQANHQKYHIIKQQINSSFLN